MDALLLIARLALAGVFGLAGVGKLLDLSGSVKAVRDFGVPERYTKIVGYLLPVAELAIAVFLLPVSTARYAALGGFLLMTAFIAGMIWNLRLGKAPDCHCFGQFHSEPISMMTVARNGVLAVASLFVLIAGWSDPGYSLLGWVDDLSGFEWTLLVISLLLVAAVAGLGWTVMQMLGQNGRVLLRLDEMEQRFEAVASGQQFEAVSAGSNQKRPGERRAGLPVGTEAPGFSLKGIHGETMSLDALLAAEKPVLLVFSDPNCGPCGALMPEVAKWQQEHADHFLTAIISRGTPAANQDKARSNGLGMVLLQENREVAEAYKSGGTPSAVVVTPNRLVATPLAEGSSQIRELVSEVIRNGGQMRVEPAAKVEAPADRPSPSRPSPSPAIGTEAPDLELADLDGNPMKLSDGFDRDAVLIFWSPTCGFCKRMANDLVEWEKQAGENDPRPIIITSGSVDANREFGFASTVLLDPNGAAMALYGTTGTPTAIKVGADGKIASELRVGQPGVMSLLRNEAAPAAPSAAAAVKAPKIGEAAPPVKLRDLEGEEFDLSSLKGRETAVLFWNPGCGFCNRMLDDLKDWERRRPDTAPELVLVSTGTIEANAAQELASPVLIDQGFQVGRSFGASGTPSAVLVDESGNIASAVAVGAPNVFDLIGRD